MLESINLGSFDQQDYNIENIFKLLINKKIEPIILDFIKYAYKNSDKNN